MVVMSKLWLNLFSNMFERPRKIQEARVNGDVEYLSAAGKKGADVTNEIKRAEAIERNAIEDAETLKRELEEEVRKLEANEHILTPDGEVVDYLKEDEE